MHLLVIIPAYNEEKTIGKVIKSIPRRIAGIKRIEVLVVDDGSTDNTVKEAKKAKANYIISHKKNQGLAKTFSDGIDKALELGADVIVNTDADDQYDQREIPKLLKPILRSRADMVIGNRQVEKLDHMPLSKKCGNILGSFTIRLLTGSKIKDISSGFRAFSRETARQLKLFSYHTYTHETIIQAINKNLVIAEIPVTFRKRKYGKSRLISGVWSHIKKSTATIIRTVLMYKAFKVLVTLGFFIMFLGILGGLRFLYFSFTGNGAGHVQSLIFSSILISIGFTTCVMGILADLISINRKIIEEVLYILKKRKS